MKKSFVFAAGVLALASIAGAQLVINEFAYDDTSTDNQFYVEIYNAGGSPVTFSGHRLIGVDNTGTIAAPDVAATLTGTINPGDYFVVGATAVPNVDQVATLDMQNDMEAVALLDGTDAVLDSVVYERNKANIIILSGLGEPAFDGVSATSGGGIWSNFSLTELNVTELAGLAVTGAASNASLSWCRQADGYDTNNNELDFTLAVATPGAANNSAGTVTLPYSNNFDTADDTIVFDFAGSFSNGRTQDPTVADTLGGYPSLSSNTNSIVASPQGGNALVVWDNTGGGNAGMLNLTAPVDDVEVETFFYIPAPLVTPDTEISEPIILRGRPDSAANTLPAAYGTTGISFRVLNNTDGAATPTNTGAVNIEVVERVAGVSTVLGTVNGVAAGWTRLYIKAVGTAVTAAVGGTYGTGDTTGTVVTGTTTITRPGGIGFNYREAVAVNANARPLTYDRFEAREVTVVSGVNDWMVMD